MLVSLPLFSANLSERIELSVEKYKLKNGMTVLLNPNSENFLANYYLGFRTGSRHESIGVTGISHMFEHLMFKGSKKYPTLDKTLSRHGVINLNAHTHFDFTGYFASFPEDKLELILDVESDRMSSLNFSQEELDKERKAVQEERKLRIENQPLGGFYGETLFDTVFKKTSYRWPIIGYKKDIQNYSLNDLKTWYKTYYSPNNAVLVISGRFSPVKAKKLIKKYFEDLKPRALPEENEKHEDQKKEASSVVLNKPVQQARVVLAWRAPSIDKKSHLALELFSDILGAGESSHLYKKLVREQGVLQEVSAGLVSLAKAGIFIIDYSLSDISQARLIKEKILNEIQTFSKTKPKLRELEKAKNIHLSSLINQLKSSSFQSQQLAYHEMIFKDYSKLYSKLDDVESISQDDISQAVQTYLNPHQLHYMILQPEVKK